MKYVFVIVSDEVHTFFYADEVWEEILMSKKMGEPTTGFGFVGSTTAGLTCC